VNASSPNQQTKRHNDRFKIINREESSYSINRLLLLPPLHRKLINNRVVSSGVASNSIVFLMVNSEMSKMCVCFSSTLANRNLLLIVETQMRMRGCPKKVENRYLLSNRPAP
jgi:hypothetical protein